LDSAWQNDAPAPRGRNRAIDQRSGNCPVRRGAGRLYLPEDRQHVGGAFAFCALAELLARVEALSRRGKSEGPVTKLTVDDLELDLLSRQGQRAGTKLDLHPREFRLLECLMRHAGQVVTRTMLLEDVWDYHFDPQTNVIDVHVSRLRQKVDRPFLTALIHTMRGAGCMLRPADV
jgi:DNA-binding response OmpR family regulator